MINQDDNMQQEMNDKNEDARILIVEDSKTQLLHLQFILKRKGFQVQAAENGIAALKILETFSPDVILSDIIMPEMDGYELCSKIKKDRRYQGIPIILLTSLTDPQDVIKGLNVGADNFIPKPFSDEFLLSRINHLLVNSRMRSGAISNMGIEIFFAGNRHLITSERMQIIDLLLSTYENAVNKNNELLQANLELSKLKEDLEQKNAELEKLNEEKNQFIGMAAHDIRNPLGGIYNFADLLEEDLKGKLSEDQLQFIGIIKSSSDLLLNMVTELLDVSKIEAGKLILKKEKQDLVGFVKDNLTKNSYLAEKKGQTIDLICEHNKIIVDFDQSRLDQVLNNLISNAIKYSNKGTHIKVQILAEGKKATLKITDQGVGIPEKEQENLFKPFSKTSAKATAGESSTGLGLFTCKKIIDSHDGEIGVESLHGKGSTFYFTLPLNQPVEKAAQKVAEVDDQYKHLEGKTVLVVDDIEMNFNFFKSALAKLPLKIEWVNDAGKAIEKCKDKKYDLILMDIYMPGLSGLEATRRIRQFDKNVFIIGQTAYTMSGMEDKCKAAGCNEYLPMPIRPKNLISIISENLNQDK